MSPNETLIAELLAKVLAAEAALTAAVHHHYNYALRHINTQARRVALAGLATQLHANAAIQQRFITADNQWKAVELEPLPDVDAARVVFDAAVKALFKAVEDATYERYEREGGAA